MKNDQIPSIGDLVTLSSNFKKTRYKTGTAPIYQWAIGDEGYIVAGRFSNDQTAVITRIALNGSKSNLEGKNKSFIIITDSGEVGWFCEGESWLIKN